MGKRKGLKSMTMNRLHYHHPEPSAAPRADVMVSYFGYIIIHSFSCFSLAFSLRLLGLYEDLIWHTAALSTLLSSLLFLHLYVTWYMYPASWKILRGPLWGIKPWHAFASFPAVSAVPEIIHSHENSSSYSNSWFWEIHQRYCWYLYGDDTNQVSILMM